MKKWQIKTLGELCDEIFAGGDVPKNNFSKIKTEDFKIPIYANGEKNLGLYGFTNISKVNSPALTISGRGTIGFSVVRKLPFFPIVRLLVLIPNSETDVQFLKYSIDNCNIKHTGSSIPQLTVPTVKGIKIPIPNLETQQAIVSKIEELFSELDKGIEDLKNAQQQLKTYRQSVLKWAFEGKLTNENVKWKFKEFKDCLSFSQGIQVDVKLQYETCNENQIRFLRIIDFTQGKDAPRYINNPGERYSVSKDEISLVRYGATTGFVCSGLEGVIANNLFKVTPKEDIINKYLYYFLKSSKFQNQISINIKGAAMPAISFGLINNIILPIPCIEEQHQIVQEIESRLSVADKMEESIAQSLQQAEALRQSILKKAFSGELV